MGQLRRHHLLSSDLWVLHLRKLVQEMRSDAVKLLNGNPVHSMREKAGARREPVADEDERILDRNY